MQRQGRAGANPLKAVSKLARKDTFNRRALSVDELVRLVAGSRKRGLAYLVAGCTGLRRGEIKQLLWTDIHLESPQPFIDVRAETTKSKKAALIPIIPALAEVLRPEHAKRRHFSGRVFPRGLPSVRMLAKDLVACGIPVEDARGFRVDFHALRHTFASLLATAGVSELARVKLARHSEWRQTDRYTDSQSLPLFTEMEKFGASLPSSIASLKSGKTGQNLSKLDPTDDAEKEDKIIPIRSQSIHLGKAVPSWESVKMVPKGGLEPNSTSKAKSLNNADLVND